MSAARFTSVACNRPRSWFRSSRSAPLTARAASASSATDTSSPSQRSLRANSVTAAVTALASESAEMGSATPVLASLAMNDSVSGPGHAVTGPGSAGPFFLSVIIDGRLDGARAREVATLAGRLGFAGVWLRWPWWPLDGPAMSEGDAAGLLAWLTAGGRVRTGLVVDAGRAEAGWLDRLVPAAASQAGSGAAAGQAGAGAAGLRVALSGTPAQIAPCLRLIAGRPGITQLALPGGAAGGASAVFVPCSPGRDLAAVTAAAAGSAGGRPVLVEVTVSVGRTAAEARARADADGLFGLAGHPAEQGLFGTLEECQAAASRLAHAGATELICLLPMASDLHDVLAQLRSIAIGASVLRPGDPPSDAPPPPAGWGGRRVIT